MDSRRRFLILALGALAVTACGGAWVAAGWWWDAANALGFIAAALLLMLFIDTGSARYRPARQPAFYARLHKQLGVLMIGLVIAHAALLFWDDPNTVEYWKLKAPLYMIAGMVAAIILLALVVTAYPAPRRLTFRNIALFRRVHGYAAVAATALVGWHIVGSAHYLDTPLKQVLVLAALCLWPVWRIRQPQSGRPTENADDAPPRRVADELRDLIVMVVLAAALFSMLRNAL